MIKVKGVDTIQFFTNIYDAMHALYIIKDFSLKKKKKKLNLISSVTHAIMNEGITTMTL